MRERLTYSGVHLLFTFKKESYQGSNADGSIGTLDAQPLVPYIHVHVFSHCMKMNQSIIHLFVSGINYQIMFSSHYLNSVGITIAAMGCCQYM
jgi:hypothetical protein